jgi:hypothetical protein
MGGVGRESHPLDDFVAPAVLVRSTDLQAAFLRVGQGNAKERA